MPHYGAVADSASFGSGANNVDALVARLIAATLSRSASALARARAQILYWAFLGFALSDQTLPRARHTAILDEMLRMASR